MRSSAGGCRQKSGGMCSCVPTISFIPVGCRSHPRSSASIGGSTEVSRSPPCPPCLRGSKRPLGGHAGRLPALRLSSPPLSTQTKGSARLVNRRPVRPPTHRTRRSWPLPKNAATPTAAYSTASQPCTTSGGRRQRESPTSSYKRKGPSRVIGMGLY